MRRRARQTGSVRSWPLGVSAAAHATLLAGLAFVPLGPATNGNTAHVSTVVVARTDLQPPDELPPDDLERPEPETVEIERDVDPFVEPPDFDVAPPGPVVVRPDVIQVPSTRFAPRRRRVVAAPPPPIVAPRAPTPTPTRIVVRSTPAPPPQAAPAATIAARLLPGATRPQFPALARRRGYTGVVRLAVHVCADGSVSRVEIEESSGHDVLDDAAAEAARTWRFAPATRGGAPVASVVRKPVRFSF